MTEIDSPATLRARILDNLAPPADRLAAEFFSPAGPFAASSFDTLPDNPSDRFTATDLLAVTLLDVVLPPNALRKLLDTDRDRFSALLDAVPADVDLWEASDEHLAAALRLYDALDELPKVGETRASKLMARKRPRLIPVIDSVIRRALALGDQPWTELRHCLADPDVRRSIEAIRPTAASNTISTLRLLDAAVWMRHSQSRNAKKERAKATAS